MANIDAIRASTVRASMGNNFEAVLSSKDLFINPDSGAMHLKQSARVSLLSSCSIIHPLFNNMHKG
jgi:hypothetical protein